MNHEPCLVCKNPLIYYSEEIDVECVICNEKFKSYISCEEEHYICDTCHSKDGVEIIRYYCLHTKSKNPIHIIEDIMKKPFIYTHGPEHHVLVGAALITAFYNSGGDVDLESAISEMESRGTKYPGGSCSLWGSCGAAVSTGMFMSIVTKATPLTSDPWKFSNEITSKSLGRIAELGGPRCCKRNSFAAVLESVKFVKENLGVEMEMPEEMICIFSQKSRECLQEACPYYRKDKTALENINF